MNFLKKVLAPALAVAGLAFAHSGIVAGGTEGLRQINAQTLGQWNVVVGTGGTVAAAIKLIEKLGGEVVKCVFLLELAGLNGREKLKGYDVETVVSYEGK